VARVEHTRAVASLPTAEAKAFAWERFTGQVDVPNYELEAAGLGLWRGGQDDVTRPYVERYFAELPATAEVRSGWVLAVAAEAFFPLSHADEHTLALATALLSDPDSLPPSVRKRVLDMTDETTRRIAIREAFPHA
jgi:aminopeptidase N